MSILGGDFVVICVCLLERCMLLGGSKCIFSVGRAIGSMKFVRLAEVVYFFFGGSTIGGFTVTLYSLSLLCNNSFGFCADCHWGHKLLWEAQGNMLVT